MRKIKGLKVVAMTLAVCCLLGLISQDVCAKSVYETGVHDTKETAMEIAANKQDIVSAAKGDRSTTCEVSGSVFKNKEDWYKVYLTKGMQYLSLNGDSINVWLWSADGTLILEESYTKVKVGCTAYEFEVMMDGYYYIKITPVGSYSSYMFTVGDPNYFAASCTVNLNPITMSLSQMDKTFDLRKVDQLPDGAIVNMICVDGVRNLTVSAIDVTNLSMGYKNNLSTYSWMKNKLESQKMPLKSRWKITFKRSTNVTFTPSITLYYVYPITSTTVENDIVLSQ